MNLVLCCVAAATVILAPPPDPTTAEDRKCVAGLDGLNDITGIESSPRSPSASAWPAWIGGGSLAALAAFVLTAWRYRQRRLRLIPQTPHSQLTLLEGQIQVDPAEYHRKLSELLRAHAYQALSLPGSLTSEQLLRETQGGLILNAEVFAALEDVLRRCDMAKFAGRHFTSTECYESARLARVFLEDSAAGR